ncbi:MAG: ATP-binding protein [Chloroflexia bacterium]
MAQRLADRLLVARRKRFVGRENERELFRNALASEELPFFVLHIYGPGGVGKSTLLKEFSGMCDELGVSCTYMDARNIEASPEAFVAALQMALNVTPPMMPLEALDADERRHVIIIDTYELLAPLDTWLREVFLPQLPADTLIVRADRRPPQPAWYTDPGWQDIVRVLPLRNLNPSESRTYLEKRHIPAEQYDEVLGFTHGHPLALSLVADLFAQRGDVRFQPESTPDVVKALLEQLVQKVPGPAHRAALEVCALVRVTNEASLASALKMPDVHDLFDWLRNLSFIESTSLGLFPHDLAREALVADLRWRNRDWYTELHNRLRAYYGAALEKTSGLEQQRVLFDYIFLHRDNPLVKPFLEWQESGTQAPDALRDSDVESVLSMVRGHEGDESAQIARYWLQRQPEGVLVFRDPEGQPAGYLHMLALEKTTAEDVESDPGLRAAMRYLAANAPLRANDRAILFRFWMGRDTYQSVSPMQSLIFVNIVRQYFTPSLTFTLIPCADPAFWAPLFAYADIHRFADADFEVGGKEYGMYGHNWRAMPALAWLNLLADREISSSPQTSAPPASVAPILVLSDVEFAGAVGDALKSFVRPDQLRKNPLLQSRMVVERAGSSANPNERATALQEIMREACDALQSSPKDLKFYRAIYHTYIKPAPTQEQAAELLDLPFSTFRRHLKEGVTRLSELLWEGELRA